MPTKTVYIDYIVYIVYIVYTGYIGYSVYIQTLKSFGLASKASHNSLAWRNPPTYRPLSNFFENPPSSYEWNITAISEPSVPPINSVLLWNTPIVGWGRGMEDDLDKKYEWKGKFGTFKRVKDIKEVVWDRQLVNCVCLGRNVLKGHLYWGMIPPS